MIENLINIIIVMVIIGSILKRMGKVAEKGREISAPSGAPSGTAPKPETLPPGPITDPLAETLRRVRQEILDRQEPMPTPSGPRERQWVEADESGDVVSVDEDGEYIVEDAEPVVVSADSPPVIPPVTIQPTKRREPALQIPSLSGAAAAQAIVAMEILGPPVSMRESGCGGLS